MRTKHVVAGRKAKSLHPRRPDLPGWAAAVRIYQSLCQNTLTVPRWLSFWEAKIELDKWVFSVEKLLCFTPCKYCSFVWYFIWWQGILVFFPLHLTWKQMSFFFLIPLKLLTEHLTKLFIFPSSHFSGFDTLFWMVPWHQDLIPPFLLVL